MARPARSGNGKAEARIRKAQRRAHRMYELVNRIGMASRAAHGNTASCI